MIFVILFLLFCREALTIRAFPAARGVIIVKERPAGGGSQRFKSGEKRDEEHCRRGMWGHRWWRKQATGTGGKIEAKGALRLGSRGRGIWGRR
jgi:hypothetical protein